jgi:predicted Kef-type K+ transport protein
MHHSTPLITTIVGGLVLAFILGMFANRLRISPLVGYLAAGAQTPLAVLATLAIIVFGKSVMPSYW